MESFLKKIFSYTLGFEWLIDLSYKLNLPSFTLPLPTVSYAFGNAFSFLSSTHRYFASRFGHRNYTVSTFNFGWNHYRVNPINFLFIPFNYLARNLGKALGWLLVSPWTIPAHYITKSVYSIKTSLQERRVNHMLKEIDPDKLVSGWLKDSSRTISAEKIAKSVHSIDFTTSWLKQIKVTGVSSLSTAEDKLLDYQKERLKVLNAENRKRIIKTTIFAFVFTPLSLLFTIPRYQNFNAERKQEVRLMELYSDQNTRTDILSQKKNLCEMGELCKAEMPQVALTYYSAVDKSDEKYQEAMQNCGEILLVHGEKQQAEAYFKEAGNNYMQGICQGLNNGRTTLGTIYGSTTSEEEEITVVSSSDDESDETTDSWLQQKTKEASNNGYQTRSHARLHQPLAIQASGTQNLPGEGETMALGQSM